MQYRKTHPGQKQSSDEKYRTTHPKEIAESRQKYHIAHRNQVRARSRAWDAAHPDKIVEHGLKSKYGITLEDYNQMFIAQAGCCKICGKYQSQLKQKLHVDHDHLTGVVRGLLCKKCNLAIGFLCDSVNLIESAARYLTAAKPPQSLF